MNGPKIYEIMEALKQLHSSVGPDEVYKDYASAIEEIISDMQQVPALTRQDKQPRVIKEAERLRDLRDELMKTQWANQIKRTPLGESVAPSTDPLLQEFDEVIRLMRRFVEESQVSG